MSSDTLSVFEKAPVPKAVLNNAVPAMAAMLMVLIYNLADTFFIAQTRNDILVAAELWERFKKIMGFSVLFSLGLSAAMTGLCYLLRDAVIRVFLTDAASFDYAVTFTGILLTTSFLFGVFYVLTNALQAMGAAAQALIINLSRQGIIYIPALFILQAVLGADGLAWAQPAADLLPTALVALLYLRTSRRMMGRKNFVLSPLF